MKQLIKTIILLSIIVLISKMVFAQEKKGVVPAAGTVTDTIDVYRPGGSGWHVIHKEAPKEILKRTPFKRTDACLKCHVDDKYRIFDAHKQRSEKGEIIAEKCLYCHVEKPVDVQPSGQGWHVIHKETPKRFLKEAPSQKTSVCFNCHAKANKTAAQERIISGNLLCQGCHGKGYNAVHPANADHILKPSPNILAMMKETEKQFGIIFSFDYEEEITCNTCHNPHERGIIPAGMIGAEGAGEKSGYRFSGRGCKPCHPDK